MLILALAASAAALLQPVPAAAQPQPAPTAVQTLPASVALALKAAGVPESNVGIVVQDLDSDQPVLALGENRSFNPASVMKLVTTLAALDSLGPAYTWTTRVWVAGEVKDGVLQGDLILQGGGDPSLVQERFWALLREIREKGIREIRGDVVIDESLYAIDPVDPGSFDDAPLRPYNAVPAALLVNYNTLRLRLDGAGHAHLDPPALALDNQTQLDPLAGCDDPEDGLSLSREDETLRLSGRYPASCGDSASRVNLLCPAATAAVWFKQLWRELGGVHNGQTQVGDVPDNARLWLEFDSPPISAIVRDINKFSNNVMAKMLYLNLGVARFGGRADWDKSERALRAWLDERGLTAPELVPDNGSGLSRIGRVSAATLARLLRWAAGRPAYYEFAASLPALGREGTLKKRLADSPLAGHAWLKTGTLNGARALAGYLLDNTGRRRVLVFLANHPNAGRIGVAQERLLDWAMALP